HPDVPVRRDRHAERARAVRLVRIAQPAVNRPVAPRVEAPIDPVLRSTRGLVAAPRPAPSLGPAVHPHDTNAALAAYPRRPGRDLGRRVGVFDERGRSTVPPRDPCDKPPALDVDGVLDPFSVAAAHTKDRGEVVVDGVAGVLLPRACVVCATPD